MQPFHKDKIENLTDVFASWMGGYPETTAEVRKFLSDKKLDTLISVNDIDLIMEYNGYFSDKTAKAVYSLIPSTLKVKNGDYALFEQTFNKLNRQTGLLKNSRVINASLLESVKIARRYYAAKKKYMDDNRAKLKSQNDQLRNPAYHSEYGREYYKRKKALLSEEEKAEQREKSRLRMQRYRQEHPESVKRQNDKANKNLSAIEKMFRTVALRITGKKYRSEHREEINAARRRQREKLRAENPEAVKEMYDKYNSSENAKQNKSKYYQRHKEEILRRARENPKTAEYKKRYKRKQRLKKTGPQIMSLLQGIIRFKEK